MSLKSAQAAAPAAAVSLAEIAVGSVVEGRVRRVEDFGVFVEVGAGDAFTAGGHVVQGATADATWTAVRIARAKGDNDRNAPLAHISD